MKRSIAIVLFDVVEELDFVGPWEIFTFAANIEPETCDVFTVSERGGEVRCAKGLRVLADHSFETAPPADVILVPGGMGTRTEVDNPRMVEYIRRSAASAELMTSVCTGSFLLARAGKRATTHWAAMDWLRGLGTVQVVDDVRIVDEGAVITSAGVSSGIDMALYIVGRLWSPELARRVQKGVEYFPDPPYADVPIPAKLR